MKAVIDTGTMITLSSTCMINVFRDFVRANRLELMISKKIAEESVWKPIANKRFALNAARIKKTINDKTLKLITPTSKINNETEKILSLTNCVFTGTRGPVKVLQAGEAEALAIAKINGAKAIFIDERTTRSLLENPLRLKQILERRQGQKISLDKQALKDFRSMFPSLKVFRSIDLIALAYEQNLFDDELEHGKLELEAAMYAAKFAGCSVSENEIRAYLKKS